MGCIFFCYVNEVIQDLFGGASRGYTGMLHDLLMEEYLKKPLETERVSVRRLFF